MFVAYFMDAMQKSVFPVQVRSQWARDDIHDLIDAHHISHAPLPNGDVVIFDGAALKSGLGTVAEIDGVCVPIAGDFIVARLSADGILTSPQASIEEVAQRVRIVSPVLEPVGAGPGKLGKAADFAIRLVRQTPRILPERFCWGLLPCDRSFEGLVF